MAELIQSIGVHVMIQSVIPAEPRGVSGRALTPLLSSKLPFVVEKAQTETAVTRQTRNARMI